MTIDLVFEQADYKVVQISNKEVNGMAMEIVMMIEREKHHEHYEAEHYEDWGKIIELAGKNGYVILPVKADSVNIMYIRLINKSLLTPVVKELVQISEELEKSYWTIQGDKMFRLAIRELEDLAKKNKKVYEAIMDVSIQKNNRYLFNRNHYNMDWDTYKDRFRLLGDNITQMVGDKVANATIERVRDLSALYSR